MLEECRKLSQAILIIDFNSVATADAKRFARGIGFGYRRRVPVLVLVAKETAADCESLLRMGCMGFLHPDAPPWQFLRAVDAVISGEIWAPRKFISNICRKLLSADDPLKLTAREEEVLALLAAGHSNRKIADLLFITRDTVRWHMRAIYRKLGVHDRSSLFPLVLEKSGGKIVRRKGK
jgi:DNA-binding NarL/FixJ family response regulator